MISICTTHLAIHMHWALTCCCKQEVQSLSAENTVNEAENL